MEGRVRAPHTPHPAPLRREAVAAYCKGASLTDLSRRLTLPVSTLNRWMADAGVSRSRAEANRLKARPTVRLRVLALAAEGLRNREIAERLGIKVGTVKQHRARLRRMI